MKDPVGAGSRQYMNSFASSSPAYVRSSARPPNPGLLVVMTWTDEPVGRIAKRYERWEFSRIAKVSLGSRERHYQHSHARRAGREAARAD